MGHVSDILETKGHDVLEIGSAATVLDAVTRMVEGNVGSLLVMEGERLVGIVTERDYLREIVLKGRTSKATEVRAIMTTELVCVGPNDSIDECMAVMTEKRIRHLPVLEHGQLAGLVSIGDVVKQLSKDQKAQIRYLTDYITGKYPA